MNNNSLVIGMDFGTASVRAILIDPLDRNVMEVAVSYYPRWKAGLYCDPINDIYRQHPLDYIECIDEVLSSLLANYSSEVKQRIVAIGTNTTGSTPIAIDVYGTPLSLLPNFQENENAMFVLWKDHSAVTEAQEINRKAKIWPTDYTKYSGGIYSSEWFWSKIWHIYKIDPDVRKHAYSWIEQSDWIPMYLSGSNQTSEIRRNKCAAGHKGMWHEEFGGYPDSEFLGELDPSLKELRERMCSEVYTSDQIFGTLGKHLQNKFGLSSQVIINVGGIDAHHGAVGAGIRPHTLVKVIGTSTCDLIVAPISNDTHLVEGICGQVKGSIIPDMLGYEAGQSAYGDIFKWFKSFLLQSLSPILESNVSGSFSKGIDDSILVHLTSLAEKLPTSEFDLVFTDYFNGRRTPDAAFDVHAKARGFNLSTSAAHMYKALVESAAFGSKAIIERLRENGVIIESIIATGGIPSKSPYVVQVLANVLECEIDVVDSDQTCALGAAIFAATAAKIFPSVEVAKQSMAAKVQKTYGPNILKNDVYRKLYRVYQDLSKTY